MNLNQLKFVIAVSEQSSFSAAAEVCCVTQPSLSNGIAAIERELGTKLFNRSTRQVQLSEFGKQLMPYFYKIIAAERELKEQAEVCLKTDKLTIKLGTTPLVGTDLSVAFVNCFSICYPDSQLLLIEDNLEELKAQLEKGTIDIILVPDTGVSVKGAEKYFIDNEPLYFLEKQTTDQPLITIDEIEQKNIIMVPDSCGLSVIIRRIFHGRKLNEYEGRAMSYQVLESWALSGLGAAIVPKSMISKSFDKFIPLISDRGPLKIDFCVFWKSELLNEFEVFLSELRDQLRDTKCLNA